MSSIKVENLSKCYHIYDKPRDRLMQMVMRGRKQYYREFWALKNVSFEVKKGETVGIIGRNGSGKSTLLQMICGTLNPTSGSVQTYGRIAALLELGSGFNPEYTGRENVYMNGAILGLTQDEIDARFEEINAFADIGDFIEQPVKTYSSGMYVRLAFAVMANVDADILIIDEALSVGDAIFVQKCMRFIRDFQKHGTLLFVSHNTQAILDICEKTIWLNDSKLQEIGHSKDVCKGYAAFIHGKLNPDCEIKKIDGNKKTEDYENDAIKDDRFKSMSIVSTYQKLLETLPNKIEVFKFDQQSPWWGKGGARISNVSIEDANGQQLIDIHGGEEINLIISCVANETLQRPIIGFIFRNNRGLEIFADNTFLFVENTPIIFPSEEFIATFRFTLPFFATGDYAIGAAIADGTPKNFIQHQRIDDALIVNVHSSHVVHGIIGLPMRACKMEKILK